MFFWKYSWCQGGGVVACQKLSWYWRRSGHTARRKLARLASEICHSPSLTCTLIPVWECWEPPLFNFSVSLGFWVTRGALWLVHRLLVLCLLSSLRLQFVSSRRKFYSFTNHKFEWSISGECICQHIRAKHIHFSLKWTHALSYVIAARSVLPLKSLNTWLFWCISQLAASNPQSRMSSEVNGFASRPHSAYWDMPASGFNLPGHRTSENTTCHWCHWFPSSLFLLLSRLFCSRHFLMW